MKKIKVLDLGSGAFPYKGEDKEEVTHVDFRAVTRPDVVHDLAQYPYPFQEGSFDKIYASHILEHLPSNIDFMEEIYRISKPDAIIVIRVPHYSGRSAWCDPTHLRAYSYYQFYYYSDQTDHYGNCWFDVEDVKLHYTRFPHGFIVTKIISPAVDFLANLNIKLCEKLWCYWVGGFSEVVVKLRTNKDMGTSANNLAHRERE